MKNILLIAVLFLNQIVFSQEEKIISFSENGYDFSITTSDSCSYKYIKTGTRATDKYIININLIHNNENVVIYVKSATTITIDELVEDVTKVSIIRKEPYKIHEQKKDMLIAYSETEGVKAYHLYYIKEDGILFQTHYKQGYTLETIKYVESLIK